MSRWLVADLRASKTATSFPLRSGNRLGALCLSAARFCFDGGRLAAAVSATGILSGGSKRRGRSRLTHKRSLIGLKEYRLIVGVGGFPVGFAVAAQEVVETGPRPAPEGCRGLTLKQIGQRDNVGGNALMKAIGNAFDAPHLAHCKARKPGVAR